MPGEDGIKPEDVVEDDAARVAERLDAYDRGELKAVSAEQVHAEVGAKIVAIKRDVA